MKDKNYNKPIYLISTVSKILNIHPQTLRQYEREGLIKPSRTNGKIRIYSQKDVDTIKTILTLTRDIGINLAGISLILKLKKEIEESKKEIESYKNRLRDIDNFAVVPSFKALVLKKNAYLSLIIEK